jgi:hypothetical protein
MNPSISTTVPDVLSANQTAAELVTSNVPSNQVGESHQLPSPEGATSNSNPFMLISVGLIPAILVIAVIILVRFKSAYSK